MAVVHQGFVPLYRARFYELLAESDEFEFVVFHGDPPSGSGHRAAPEPLRFPNHRVANRELSLAGRTAIAQSLIGPVAQGSFSAAVLGAELKFVSSFAVAALFRAWGKPVILWGQGYEKAEATSVGLPARAGAAVKRRAARSADGYLVYTEGGARRLREAGVDPTRVTVVRNTLDISREEALREDLAQADPDALRSELGVPAGTRVLLYIGRLYREKQADQLVELARRLFGRREQVGPVMVVIVGEGPDRARVEALAEKTKGIRFAGELYERELARWLRVSTAVTLPGKVGLTVNHALAHGVPVLTRESDLHAPEVEYLRDGVNGRVVAGDFEAYVEAVSHVLTSPDTEQRLRAGALRSLDSLRLEAMASAFSSGVSAALERRSR